MGRSGKMSGLVPLLLACILLGGCEKPTVDEKNSLPETTGLKNFRETGELVVVTRNAPTTYYVDRHDKPTGFEHDLAQNFAEHLELALRFEIRHSIGEIKEALRSGEAHLAAAGLTRLETREEEFQFGPSYHQIQQQLVCRRGGNRPDNLDELPAVSLMVIADSSYEERLEELREERLPDLEWEVEPSTSTELVLQKVWEKEVDCTVADSNIVAISRRYYPELIVVMPMSEPQELAWMMPRQSSELAEAVNEWFHKREAKKLVDTLMTRYYAHVEIFDYVDTSRYVRRIYERLPEFLDIFKRAGEKYGIDWRLLAAQAYQESHWNPMARSPTGVRGIMMLTLPTAAEVNVNNRLDPEESIMGGARYLASLRQRLPAEIEEPDRTWIALAAYNVGMGHIYDARRLARNYGLDPNLWSSLQQMLPKLAQPEYHRYLPHGYARGDEPVQYLRRIRNYRELLERHFNGQKMVAARPPITKQVSDKAFNQP